MFCILLMTAAITVSAQQKDEISIRKLMDDQTKAWNAGDLEGFMKGYWKSDSLMFIGSSGVTYGWEATLNNYRKNYPDTATMGILTFDILLIKPLSNIFCHAVGLAVSYVVFGKVLQRNFLQVS